VIALLVALLAGPIAPALPEGTPAPPEEHAVAEPVAPALPRGATLPAETPKRAGPVGPAYDGPAPSAPSLVPIAAGAAAVVLASAVAWRRRARRR
jgi:hypothetical protein